MRRTALVALLSAVILLIAGCTGGGNPNELVYSGPSEQSIAMGETIPGTNIRYAGYSDQGAEVLINDQRAIKKVGDSLDWQGSPVPGAQVKMSQRILFANDSRLQTVGTVKVTVQSPQPQVTLFPGQTPYTYKVAVTHVVRKGDAIPGTLITYQGKTDEGARFGGLQGYPYRKIGDSVVWTGQLRPGVFLDSTYRVVAYTEELATLAALATIALAQ